MRLTIEGEPKEIAEFLKETETRLNMDKSLNEILARLNRHKPSELVPYT